MGPPSLGSALHEVIDSFASPNLRPSPILRKVDDSKNFCWEIKGGNNFNWEKSLENKTYR
ncbi:hypothetical protein TRIUR3_26366 [Triticum urartu]|uniref:Uncharacterized protein n=1 Tax=Triticum urartu TaxID=4572 RepID=M7Y8Z0_TRIUA|nr:hypothetical protein TRIUR3_26366 [Triticum urartu]